MKELNIEDKLEIAQIEAMNKISQSNMLKNKEP
jgi:hypothetical protein